VTYGCGTQQARAGIISHTFYNRNDTRQRFTAGYAEGRRPVLWALMIFTGWAFRRRIRGQGLGKKLMDLAEQYIRNAGGRLFIVETSGRESYRPTRTFYERIGYTPAGKS